MPVTKGHSTDAVKFVTDKGYKRVAVEGDVSLFQSGRNPKRYAVTYGKQFTIGMDYGQAATEYGACLMHQLVCDGILVSEPED